LWGLHGHELDARCEVRVHLHHSHFGNLGRSDSDAGPTRAAAEPRAARRHRDDARRRCGGRGGGRDTGGRRRRARHGGRAPPRPPAPLPAPAPRRPSSRRAPSAARRRGRSSRGASPRGAPPAVGWAAAPGTPGPSEISYWPLSSFLRLIRPRCAASTTNLLKREKPMSFSLNVGSISCITCFSRSERITSLCAVICFTASTTSSHGSRR